MANIASNYFQAIDPRAIGDKGASEAEMTKRRGMNSQIDFLNEMAQLNQGNKSMQNYLAEQYFGMVFPQQEDPDSQFAKAADLIALGGEMGNTGLAGAGESMLKGLPGFSQFFDQGAQGPESERMANEARTDQLLQTLQGQLGTMTPNDPRYNFIFDVSGRAQEDPNVAQQYFQPITKQERQGAGTNLGIFKDIGGGADVNPLGNEGLDELIKRQRMGYSTPTFQDFLGASGAGQTQMPDMFMQQNPQLANEYFKYVYGQ